MSHQSHAIGQIVGTEPTSFPQGTLLWIGPRDPRELEQPFHQADCWAAQIAYRGDWKDAAQRPATDVSMVFVVCNERSELDEECWKLIAARHVDAKWIQLNGPMCEGISQAWKKRFLSHSLDCQQLSWHQTTSEFAIRNPPSTTPTTSLASVAIMAANLNAAEPLLEFADSMNVAALWCRHPQTNAVRAVQAVWWDDSLAPPTNPAVWRRRTAQRGLAGAEQTWICNRASLRQIQQAKSGGVHHVLQKPYFADHLLATLQDLREGMDHAGNSRWIGRFAA